ncbi:hypothetical protein PoB_006144400 [Plakobranchus ocellatus]|uniref:Uncharacterized protein n=1 Tax=Plakobranchus ocellatus TaxID=259542 RepID=A0AAV4CSS1_9GAST|nr:hypothetical protein PoB_006144400 [Plakobranchus ocellatus]
MKTYFDNIFHYSDIDPFYMNTYFASSVKYQHTNDQQYKVGQCPILRKRQFMNNLHERMMRKFKALCQTEAPVVELKPATEWSLQISGRTH